MELSHREHPVTGRAPWPVMEQERATGRRKDREAGGAVRDPVARCSCWLLHRIYTAYWAADSHQRAARQQTGVGTLLRTPSENRANSSVINSHPKKNQTNKKKLPKYSVQQKWESLMNRRGLRCGRRGQPDQAERRRAAWGRGRIWEIICWRTSPSLALSVADSCHSFPLALRHGRRRPHRVGSSPGPDT